MNMRLFLAGLAIGAALAWYLLPKPATQVKTEQQTRIEYQVRTVERTITRPDGTKETVKETNDTSVQIDKSKQVATVYAKPQWNLGLSAGAQLRDFTPIYGLQVTRRIIGPVFAGIYARTDTEIGLLVTMEF